MARCAGTSFHNVVGGRSSLCGGGADAAGVAQVAKVGPGLGREEVAEWRTSWLPRRICSFCDPILRSSGLHVALTPPEEGVCEPGPGAAIAPMRLCDPPLGRLGHQWAASTGAGSPVPAYLRGAVSLLRENKHNANKTSNEGRTSSSTLCGDRGHAVGWAHLCECAALDRWTALLPRRRLSL